jgi:hypothetical protein
MGGTTEDSGCYSWYGERFFLLYNIPTGVGFNPASCKMGAGVCSPGVERPGREAPPSSAKVKDG